MAAPSSVSSSSLRVTSLALGLAGAVASLGACNGDVINNFTTSAGGSGGSGGSTTTNTGATTTTTSTTTDTTTTTSQGGGGSGGTGGVAQGGGGSGGVPDPWAGPIESLTELDLGDLEFGTQMNIPIPDKTLGFTVQAQGGGATDVVGIYRLRPPIGGSVVFNFAMVGHDTQVFGGQQFIGVADPQADSADAYPVKTGNWKLTLGSDGNSGAGAHVRSWVRRTKDGLFHGGVVDVNLFIVPGVASGNYMSQVLDAFFPYAGLTKGTVDTFSPDSGYSTIGSQDEYRQMLASTGGLANAPVINLFVVDNFSDQSFGGAIGVAGGIPGSPMRHGTTQSGLAYEPTGDPNYDATILMHEIGHLGGLFHTTEFQITETDPLSDTTTCDPGTIQNNPDACPDKTNVMFPIAYGAKTFSTAQLNVLHGSALYRGILEEGGTPAGPLALVPSGNAPPASKLAAELLPAGARVMPVAPDPLERALGALWCSGGFTKSALAIARDPNAKLTRAAKTASARLRAVVLDDAMPVLLRKRALSLYLQAARDEGIEEQALDFIVTIAERATVKSIAERRLQSAALRLVLASRATSPKTLTKRMDAALATALSSGDALLAAVAAGQ